MQDHSLNQILPCLMNGEIINQISSLLQQNGNAQPIHTTTLSQPIKVETSDSCLSPTDSMSSTSAIQSPSCSSVQSGANKRPASQSELDSQLKRIKEEDEDLDESEISAPIARLMKPIHLIKPDDVFTTVPGRLSVLTSSNKYKVTVAELQRRLSPPENLNASIIGAMLRRAKSKNGGKELRSALEDYGLVLPAGKRKLNQITLFTSMIEGEAEHLAKDFDFLCNNEFPANDLAALVLSKNIDAKNEKNRQTREEELKTARKLINELMDVLTSSEVEAKMTNFQMLTHNFGTSALFTVFGVLNTYFNAQLELVQTRDTGMAVPTQNNAVKTSVQTSSRNQPATQSSVFSLLNGFENQAPQIQPQNQLLALQSLLDLNRFASFHAEKINTLEAENKLYKEKNDILEQQIAIFKQLGYLS